MPYNVSEYYVLFDMQQKADIYSTYGCGLFHTVSNCFCNVLPFVVDSISKQ